MLVCSTPRVVSMHWQRCGGLDELIYIGNQAVSSVFLRVRAAVDFFIFIFLILSFNYLVT